jgi:phosphatidylglycerol:prolipoprotein diacylglycerol transferase
MHPVLIDFGLFKLHTYGLMIAIAFLVGMQLAVRDARRVDLSKSQDFDQFILDLDFWILIAAMVGARVVFIIVNWGGEYARDPLKVFRIWEGGLVFYGGLIGAVVFSVYYSWRKKHDFFLVADLLIPFVALGQFFGRLGCFAAGCCWGKAVDPGFLTAVQFPAGSLIHNSMQRTGEIGLDALHTIHVHPVQLYESAGTLTLFFLLQAMRLKKRFHGQQLLTYLFLYPLLRSSLELIRGDKERGLYNVFGEVFLSTSQIISAGIATIAFTLLVVLLLKRGSAEPKPAAA